MRHSLAQTSGLGPRPEKKILRPEGLRYGCDRKLSQDSPNARSTACLELTRQNAPPRVAAIQAAMNCGRPPNPGLTAWAKESPTVGGRIHLRFLFLITSSLGAENRKSSILIGNERASRGVDTLGAKPTTRNIPFGHAPIARPTRIHRIYPHHENKSL